jgi:uncharacterized protein Usg
MRNSRHNPRTGQGAFELQLKGYRLSTAEIVYHMPDHPSLLQTFIWQHYDIAPDYPELRRFLEFWQKNIEGKLHSVRIARLDLVRPGEWRAPSAEFAIN